MKTNSNFLPTQSSKLRQEIFPKEENQNYSEVQSNTLTSNITNSITSHEQLSVLFNKNFVSRNNNIRKKILVQQTINNLKKFQLDNFHRLENSKKVKNFQLLILRAGNLLLTIEANLENLEYNDIEVHKELNKIAKNLNKEIANCKDKNTINLLEAIKLNLKEKIRAATIYFIQKNTDIIESYLFTEYIENTIKALTNLTNITIQYCDDEDDKNLLNKSIAEIKSHKQKLDENKNRKTKNSPEKRELSFDKIDKKILDGLNSKISYVAKEYISIHKVGMLRNRKQEAPLPPVQSHDTRL